MKFMSQLNPDAETFQSDTGEPIPNQGNLRLPLYMREGTVRGVIRKATPETKPLGSITKICQAGDMVVYDEEGSFIIKKSVGAVNWMREENGNHMLQGSNKGSSRNTSFHGRS